jgi:hypothetical protein
MKLEYVALRAEILQSISYQHQILLAGYGASGAFVSYVAVKSAAPSFIPALIIVPFILLGMASLWIVECNRMVRAGYYIGRELWQCFREDLKSPGQSELNAGWECWIRLKDGDASHFRERQHRSQCLVVLWGPVFLSAVASIVAILDAFLDPPKSDLQPFLPWILLGFALLAGALWRRIYQDLRPISDLGETPISDTRKDSVGAVSAG